jgi:hypothetical protein
VIATDSSCRVITSSFLRILAVVALLLAPVCIHAQDHESPGVRLPVSRLASWTVDWAFADLDGDKQPDLAIAHVPSANSLYHVNLRLSGNGASSGFDIRLDQRSGLTISAQDVDGDHDLDLVITSGILRQPVGVWLNDGVGNFSKGDSSLYPERIWRGPPGLYSRSISGASPDARLEQSRSIIWADGASAFELAPVIAGRTFPAFHPLTPCLPGQWRVRPPPAV